MHIWKDEKTLPVLNLIVLLITIGINYLSNTGISNGQTVGSVSDRYHTLITPAPYTFGIWGVIYLGLLGFAFYHLKFTPERASTVQRIGWRFIVSCVANSSWVLAWIYGYTGLSVVIMLVLLGSLVSIVLRTRMELDDVSGKTLVFLWWPFTLYLGWTITACIVNIAAWLVSRHWGVLGFSVVGWAVVAVVVAGIVYHLLVWLRNMREAAIVGVWALIGVVVADKADAPAVAYAAGAVAVTMFVSAMVHGGWQRWRAAH